jgi:hypothetical protein
MIVKKSRFGGVCYRRELKKRDAMKKLHPAIIFSSILICLMIGCATIPKGFELAPDKALVHMASGAAFPETIASFTRGSPTSYNAEGTDISVQYFMLGARAPFLDMYIFPGSDANGPIGLIRQHVDFVASVTRLHPGAAAESDSDVYVTQGGARHRATQATFTYPEQGLYTFGRKLYSLLIEFEYEGWFVSYRMDVPIARWTEARALLRDFIDAAPLPPRRFERTSQSLAGIAKTGSPQEVRSTIAGGAAVNAKGSDGLTALMGAAMHSRDPGVIAALLNAGADPAARSANGETALMYAAMANSNPDVLAALLKAGADVEARNSTGVTALIYAAGYNPEPSIIMLLLAAGADLEGRAANGATPLFAACWRNPDLDVVMALLSAGADVSARDTAGHTALMWAAMYNENPEVVVKLLEAGADAKAKDTKGKTVLDYLETNMGLRGTEAERRLKEASR